MTLSNLSPRERQVVDLYLDFYTGKEIANRLRISDATVSVTIASARRKYQAYTTGELLRRVRLQVAQ